MEGKVYYKSFNKGMNKERRSMEKRKVSEAKIYHYVKMKISKIGNNPQK